VQATIARYFIAAAARFYGVEQLLHAKYVPAVMDTVIFGGAIILLAGAYR
jgi:hypothetical protein